MNLTTFVENAGILVPIIIGATAVFTQLVDKAGKFERFYPLVPFLLGVVGAVVLASPKVWDQIVVGIFMYGFGAMGTYKIAKTTILGK